MKQLFSISFLLLLAFLVTFTACSDDNESSHEEILTDIVVEIDASSLTIVKGYSAVLTANVQSYEVSDFRVTWSSSNTAVATVNDEGNVTAISKGEAIITATSVADKKKKASCTVTVVNVPSETKTFTVKGVNFDMKLVEPGTFQMGNTNNYKVTISKHYYIGETEVTQALWQAVTGYTPTASSSWDKEYGLGDNYPAYKISYEDVQSFLTKLNNLTGIQFRMPTEAEWEFAALGGTKSKGYTYSGSNNIDEVAWYYGNSNNMIHTVKTKAANELGIYDMSGNAYEWCSDWYGDYPNHAMTDPTGPESGSDRIIRGGCHWGDSDWCRTKRRMCDPPSSNFWVFGVRLACSAILP